MSDLIDRQAAIAVADSSDYVGLSVEDVKKVTDEVVKGLKQLPSAPPEQPSREYVGQLRWERDLAIQQLKDLGYGLGEKIRTDGDTISRQAAIDALTEYGNGRTVYISVEEAFRRIEQLPSAQPEIIRCKDCKYCEHWYADKGRCFLWHEGGIDVFEDGFCNYAERRTDEAD